MLLSHTNKQIISKCFSFTRKKWLNPHILVSQLRQIIWMREYSEYRKSSKLKSWIEPKFSFLFERGEKENTKILKQSIWLLFWILLSHYLQFYWIDGNPVTRSQEPGPASVNLYCIYFLYEFINILYSTSMHKYSYILCTFSIEVGNNIKIFRFNFILKTDSKIYFLLKSIFIYFSKIQCN